MANGVRVTEPPVGSPNIENIDTVDVDFGGGDLRKRQRIVLSGNSPTSPDVFVKTTEPLATDGGIVVRQAGPIRSDLQVGGLDVGPTNPVPVSGPVGLLGPNGQPISSTNRLPVDIGGATVSATFSSFVSVGNSTQTPLAANATFTGAWEDVKDYAAIIGSLISDQPSAVNGVVAEFALDAAGTQLLSNQTTTYPGGGVGAYFAFAPEARYVRIRYTNGATAQTYLRSQVAYEFTAPTIPHQALAGQLTDANIGGVMRSAITARLSTGQWKSLLSTAAGELAVNWATPTQPANNVVTGTLTAAAGAAPVSQTVYPAAGATAVQMTVPDGHESWQIYISGVFSAGSQIFFEGSSDGTDASWFALNGRRNPDATTNETSTLLDSSPFGGPSPVGAGLSNWRGVIGGVKFFRVRCGTFTTGDSINVRMTTSVGGGPVFQQGPPPLPTDFYTLNGALTAVNNTAQVKTVGCGAWSAYMLGNFTGTVYFEQTVDGINWTKINGAVAGVGTLQTQFSGTGTANQALAVRGSCGGIAAVRLRAGTDFVGSFTGTLRAGGGTAGVFLTAPVPIAGLSNGAQTLRQIAGTGGTATRVDPSPLATRTSVEIKAMSTNSVSVFVGFTSGVTTGTGREVLPGEAWTLDVTTATQLFAVAASANQGLQVTEVG